MVGYPRGRVALAADPVGTLATTECCVGSTRLD